LSTKVLSSPLTVISTEDTDSANMYQLSVNSPSPSEKVSRLSRCHPRYYEMNFVFEQKGDALGWIFFLPVVERLQTVFGGEQTKRGLTLVARQETVRTTDMRVHRSLPCQFRRPSLLCERAAGTKSRYACREGVDRRKRSKEIKIII